MPEFEEWRASLNPLVVDVVGDFAGRGVFAIHGEALLTHCLTNARVDFDYGFQLLHVVHAVEAFLVKLRDRGCIFNVFWFENEADVCMPSEVRADSSRASKYRLARAVLIQHFSSPTSLSEPNATRFSHTFPNLASRLFREYLDSHPLHFFLGSNAHDEFPDIDQQSTPLGMLYLMASAGYYVAFIEGVEFKSSKAYFSLTTPRGKVTPLPEREEHLSMPSGPSSPMAEMMKKAAESEIADGLTAREFISVFLVLSSVDVDALFGSSKNTVNQTSEGRDTPSGPMSTVLPFSHPVMDQYLADVQLQLTGVASESTVSEKIFEELAHWRNTKPLIDPKHIAKPKGFFAKKKHQQFMSDTIAYSASLTGASGKNIDPETIIAQDPASNPKTSTTNSHNTKKPEKAPKTKEGPKTNKQKAHEKAEALMLEKQAVISSFDSAPDPRVPSFHPDAWQRKVLDAIDANKSVLAVAPTSAGKTFISFYAMKKVLQANDDDILVYVAPTKALVNQIAAEIQARFSKHYGNREGRSVWAIHTRDNSVNSHKGCQILVTVPSILQILLLAPLNAKAPTDFSRRIKRIIFDEVHCIGQSDEGVVWEQLLLLAPCPIIALSATIANAEEFRSWLEQSQNVKGFELEMIVHSSRYSDLRKFIHDPAPSVSEFTGLAPVERLPYPGLDAELTETDPTPFLFIHPIASIVDRNRDTLNDASLEPKDCLSLWKAMNKHASSAYPMPPSLDPKKALPEVIGKSDVVRWEAELKDHLAEWMADSKSPFDAVQEELRGDRYSRLAESYTELGFPDDSGEGVVDAAEKWPLVSTRSVFSLVTDLRASGALPAILFNYDRAECEAIGTHLFEVLTMAEKKYRATNPAWIAKMAAFEAWKKAQEASKGKNPKKASSKRREEDGDEQGKANSARDAANRDVSKWESFDPDAPLAQFSFADNTKISKEELEERLRTIWADAVQPPFVDALRRGVGVHHAGMNRQYRQVVEMLFRKGYLTVVIATGTLAMGINMPCKTVVFTGDSIFLTALNYRQASGRAGRRGFDMLGNVVFHHMPPHRALEVMSAKLPDLRGQFPASVTLILRLFILLHGTDNSSFAADAVKSLITQNRLYLGGPEAQMSITHHLRFSIDYLRRQNMLSKTGVPLNFAGLVDRLHYTESAAFAFQALLQGGYFHEVCAGFSPTISLAKWREMALELVLTLSHLF
ncbi:hypothetical protein F5144DRAFT_457365, partial [Chaetomium tenue]